jgi:hypothetical protein
MDVSFLSTLFLNILLSDKSFASYVRDPRISAVSVVVWLQTKLK